MLFLCYPKCSTCQKAKAWLDERGISYELRDIKPGQPTAEELTSGIGKAAFPEEVFQRQRLAVQGAGTEG